GAFAVALLWDRQEALPPIATQPPKLPPPKEAAPPTIRPAPKALLAKTDGQAAEQPPAGWKEYRSPAGRFAVWFPGVPKEGKRVNKLGGAEIESHEAKLLDRETKLIYNVTYCDFPPLAFRGDEQTRLDVIRDGTLKNVPGELLRETPVRL